LHSGVGMNDRESAARVVSEAILHALEADPKTREPLNAFIVWTEIGKGFAGLLERKGASVGLLRSLIEGWCTSRGAPEEVDLARWAYALEPDRRMSVVEIGEALCRAQFQIERALVASGHVEGADSVRDAFLTTVRGWFPLGIRLLRSFPIGRGADERELCGALRAWCRRYLQKDTEGAKDLGVRMARSEAA
jgi:hypothetical protein